MGSGSGLRAKQRKAIVATARTIENTAATIPLVHAIARWLRPRGRLFGKAYANRTWGSAESGSGVGSELGATSSLRPYLPEIFNRLNVRTFLDAPCGDWNWMRTVDLTGVDYTGADVVPEVIASNQERFARPCVRFLVADLTKDDLPRADLILCRDCWVHLSFQDIGAMLENFRRSGAAWLLVSNSPHVETNENKLTSLRWRYLNLRKAPFHFPPALESRKDHYADVQFEITLWRIADLPSMSRTSELT
jgi:SAM-dependent methyltransferase